ncbi:ArnT family glycosyltransferase [Sphingomonas bacterium]|uniref:ArnT family glycosyltransferase n=1 Tax=Sphingomonas bacterium TaxID=1895847 RepID=UPI0015758BCE|nr:glycosyltransferase family 39 protein [Sphingomonas bacterium]
MNEKITGARWHMALALSVVATFAIRSLYFGDPVVDADEQFYLLTGDRLLHGALPYVDIWDRKPVGLFLLYAGIRLLGGDGILAYQLVAAGFVAATAIVIATIARRIAGAGPAIVAAIAYPLAIGWSGGMGGQSPVLYNLPMAAAALLIVGLLEDRPRSGSLAARGTMAMLLVGTAMQIKYSALYEGIYFGLALLWIGWRGRIGIPRLAACAGLWIAVALVPTLLAFAAYAAMGHAQAFVFANFTSILLRHNESAAYQALALAKMLARLSPFLVALLAGEILRRRQSASPTPVVRRFVLGWAGAALIGILLFGNYFNHYALPWMVPLAIAAAPAFALRPRALGIAFAAVVLAANGIAYGLTWQRILHRSGDRAYAERIAGTIRAHLGAGCLYVFNGEPILYHLTGSCLPTRWPFPYHLSFRREATALGIDPLAEVRAIMARRPSVVVDTIDPTDPDVNRAAQAIVRADLARHYRPVAAFRLRRDIRMVYARLR